MTENLSYILHQTTGKITLFIKTRTSELAIIGKSARRYPMKDQKEAVKKVIDYIEKNLEKDISLDKISRNRI